MLTAGNRGDISSKCEPKDWNGHLQGIFKMMSLRIFVLYNLINIYYVFVLRLVSLVLGRGYLEFFK